MSAQMMRVISSPSISTTGLATLMTAMRQLLRNASSIRVRRRKPSRAATLRRAIAEERSCTMGGRKSPVRAGGWANAPGFGIVPAAMGRLPMRVRDAAIIVALAGAFPMHAGAQQPDISNAQYAAERAVANDRLLQAEKLLNAGQRGPESEPCKL